MADTSEVVKHKPTHLKQREAANFQLNSYIANVFETIDGKARCISTIDHLIYALISSDGILKSVLDDAIYVHDGLTVNIDDVSKVPETSPNASPKLQRWIDRETLKERLNAGYTNVMKATKEQARYYSEKLNVSLSALTKGDNRATDSKIDVHLQCKSLSSYTVVLPTSVLKTLSANRLPIAKGFVKANDVIWELSHRKLKKVLQTGSKVSLLNLPDKTMTLALQCSSWPKFLDEWLLRKRYHKWPSAETIVTIKRFGFLLIPIETTTNLNTETEWQLDFTNAEKYLLSSLSSTQIQCLLMLHQLVTSHGLDEDIPLKAIVHTVFWMAEQIPDTAWPEDGQQMTRLVYCMNKLLDFLEEKCIKDNHLPNYFAPQQNMMRAQSMEHDMDGEQSEGGRSVKKEGMTVKFTRARNDIRSEKCFTFNEKSPQSEISSSPLSNDICDTIVKDTIVDLNHLLTVDDDLSRTIMIYHDVISRLSASHGSDLLTSILYVKLGLLYLSRSLLSTSECDSQSSAQLAKAYMNQGNVSGLLMHKVCKANLHYSRQEYEDVVSILKELVNNPYKLEKGHIGSNDPFLKCLVESNLEKSIPLSKLELKAFDFIIVEPFVTTCSDRGVSLLPCHAIAFSLFINSAIKLGRISLAKGCLRKFVSHCYRDSSGCPIEASIFLRKQRVTNKVLGLFGWEPETTNQVVLFDELDTQEEYASKGAELHALGASALMLKDHTTATLAFDLAMIYDPSTAELLPNILASAVVPFDNYSYVECLLFLFIQAPINCVLFCLDVISHPLKSFLGLYNLCLLNTLIIIDDAIPIGGYAKGAGWSAVTAVGRLQRGAMVICDEALKGVVFISLTFSQGCVNIMKSGLDASLSYLSLLKSQIFDLMKKCLVLQTIGVRSLTHPVTFLLACRVGVVGLLTYIKHCFNSITEYFSALKQDAIDRVNSTKDYATDIWTVGLTYVEFQQRLFQTGMKGFNALTPLFQSANALTPSKSTSTCGVASSDESDESF